MGSEFLCAAVKAKLDADLREILELGLEVTVATGDRFATVTAMNGRRMLPAPVETEPVPTAKAPAMPTRNAGKMCDEADCDRDAVCRGKCGKHYQQLLKAKAKKA